MKKYLSVLGGVALAISLSACGGGSSNNAAVVHQDSNINIEGEWKYVSTLPDCDKKEEGTFVIEKISSTQYSWKHNSSNDLEEDCTYSGARSSSGTYTGSVDNVSQEQFNTYLSSINSSSHITSVVFNSTGKLTVEEVYNGKNFTTIFTRDDSSFDGNTYFGIYLFQSGNSYNCDASGNGVITVSNSKVNGRVSGSSGTIYVNGYEVANGKFQGTTSDGTTWSGIITSAKAYGTYRNATWNCNGTWTLNRTAR